MLSIRAFLPLALVLSTLAFAENDRGNGGDSVVCRNEAAKITSARLLDYYEAQGKELHFELELTDEAYFRILSKKLLRFDSLASHLGGTFKGFDQNARELLHVFKEYWKTGKSPLLSRGYKLTFVEGLLVDIKDSHPSVPSLPPGCDVEQLVIYRQNPDYHFATAYDHYWLTLQKTIFENLPASDLRGIILHEALYKVLRDNLGVKTSDEARLLHRLILSVPLKDLDMSAYLRIRRAMHKKYPKLFI